jgi:hypothetical protein
MLFFEKHLMINKFNLPKEIIHIIKEYVFHKIKKIQKNDQRYKLLLTIPHKIYNTTYNNNYVLMRINEKKYYCLIHYYNSSVIELQTLLCLRDNALYPVNKNIIIN